MIRNPATGRMVKIDGAVGKRVIQQYGGDNCIQYHGQPIKCQATSNCFYTLGAYRDPTGKSYKGQCKNFAQKDLAGSKDRSRKRQGLEQQFDRDAASRLRSAWNKRKFHTLVTDAQQLMQRADIKLPKKVQQAMQRSEQLKEQARQVMQRSEQFKSKAQQVMQRADIKLPKKVQQAMQRSEQIKLPSVFKYAAPSIRQQQTLQRSEKSKAQKSKAPPVKAPKPVACTETSVVPKGQCCDKKTRYLRQGAQMNTYRWCKN